jgi:hypothetical protein
MRVRMCTYMQVCMQYVCFYAPIAVARRSRAYNIFASSNTGIVCSNLTRLMDVCVLLVCVILCVGRGLTTGWSQVQVVYTVYMIKKLKTGQDLTKGL